MGENIYDREMLLTRVGDGRDTFRLVDSISSFRPSDGFWITMRTTRISAPASLSVMLVFGEVMATGGPPSVKVV